MLRMLNLIVNELLIIFPFLSILSSQQVRGMATLKMISIRLKSVKNIQKITQSMKMVSAAKYTKAERELKLARPYGIGAQEFYKKAEVKGSLSITRVNFKREINFALYFCMKMRRVIRDS